VTDALPRPQGILFDWDNTLVDNWGAIHAALNRTLVAMGHEPWTLQDTRRNVARSLRDSFPALFGERWTEARDIFYKSFEAVHLEELKPMPGAGDMLAALAGRGLYLGVVSNKTGHYLRSEADRLGWTRHFGRLVGATDASADKPAVEPVDLALGDSGLAKGPAIWFVGDGAIDLQCAANARLTPIFFGKKNDVPSDAPRPAWVCPDCDSVLSLVAERFEPNMTG
jgi:phosphoglycolate phosphatase